jgi:hypothetical protein
MGSTWSRRISVPLAAAALGLFPAGAAGAVKDYALNGATGDYTPAVVHKNYALNGATGDVAPPPAATPPSVHVVAVSHDPGFAWGDAAIGAAAALIVLLAIGTTSRRVRRRRIPAGAPARPTAA